MAGELQASYSSGRVVYFLVRSRIGQIWNTVGGAFETYSSVNYSAGDYNIAGVEQGTSGYYTGTFPAAIPPGTYSATAKQQIGGSVAESDPTVAVGNVEWNGSALAPLSDTAVSGQVAQFLPLRLARGTMIKPFMFQLVSSLDHITPFTSGIVSGQINRDAGGFGVLQSGSFVEQGLGWYALQALTSGDLLANNVALTFTAVGVSGIGTSDPRNFLFILQRTSGQ